MRISRSVTMAALLLCSAMMGCQSTAKPLQEQLPPEFKDIQYSSDLLFERELSPTSANELMIYPEGLELFGFGGQRHAFGRLLPNGDVEVGAELEMNPVEEVSKVFVAVYPNLPGSIESASQRVDRILKSEKSLGMVEARFDAKTKKHLGMVTVKAEDLFWQGLWWAPETADTSRFLVSVLIIGKNQAMTRTVFGATVLRPKKKK